MKDIHTNVVEILRGLGGHPATPFFEGGPARYISRKLDDVGIPYHQDGFGNIVARLCTSEEPGCNPIAFVAHMDHPGFEITQIEASKALAHAVGGIPVISLVAPTPINVITPDGRVPGVTARHETTQDPRDRNSRRLVWVNLESELDIELPVPAVFDLPDFDLQGQHIRMRALDDLAGCAAILAVLERLSESMPSFDSLSSGQDLKRSTLPAQQDIDLYGVFTRAEEEGLLGARLMAQAEVLPINTLVVSIEASAVIPGISIGEGPVIRTGDAAYTFDAETEQVLTVASEILKDRDPDFKVQRQLMSGGVCEATAFALNGYKTTGLAFPLGNYHNATTRIMDLDGGIDSEYIAMSDFLGGVDLLAEAAISVSRRYESKARRWIKEIDVPDEVRKRLVYTRDRY